MIDLEGRIIRNFAAHCLNYENQPFIIEPFGQREMTYGELMHKSAILMKMLFKHGITKGDRVVLCFNNQLEFVISHFALLRVGAIAIPLQPTSSNEKTGYILEQTQPRIILANRAMDFDNIGSKVQVIEVNAQLFENSTKSQFEYKDVYLDDEDPIAILYTSGTTGIPKGAVMKYGAVVADFLEYGEALGFNHETRFILAMPVWHSDGWDFSVLLPFLFGASVLLLPPFDAKIAGKFDWLLNEARGNVLVAVPSMLSALLTLRYRYKQPIKGLLKAVLCGSAKLHQNIIESFEKEFGTRILENYGLTETLLIAHYSPGDQYKQGSVGKVSPQCEVRFEEDGEILVSSPFLFEGYYLEPELTAKAYDGKWFHTGDLGYVDEERYLYLKGRKRNVINKAGIKIDPNEIDEVFLRYPCVTDVVTIGVEDTVYGQEIIAFVTVSDTNITAEVLENHARTNLEKVKRPKSIHIVPAIYRNNMGKVNRDELLSLQNQVKIEGREC
ncbi:MAG: class I adenylate-forming enzyme family protein [Ruminiclostridium sp.]